MKASLKNISDLIKLRQLVESSNKYDKDDILLCIDTYLLLIMDEAKHDLNRTIAETKSNVTRAQLYSMVQSLSENQTGCKVTRDICRVVSDSLKEQEVKLESLKVS